MEFAFEHLPYIGECSFRLLPAPAKEDSIISVTHCVMAPFGHFPIKAIEIDIGQEGTYDSPLQRSILPPLRWDTSPV